MSGPASWMVLAAFAFAAMGAFTSLLGARCDWLAIALVRALFMLATSALLARWAGVRLVAWRPSTLWLRSLAGSFSLVGNFYALTRLPEAEALTLSNAYPIWIVLLSAALIRRPPTGAEVLGVACGVLGVVLMQRPQLTGFGPGIGFDLGEGDGHAVAVLVALISSVSTALAMIGLHRLRGVDPRAVVAHFSGVASLVAVLGLALRLALRPSAIACGLDDPTTPWMLLGVGLTGTIGQFFLTRAYAAGVPTRVSVIGLTQVVFAMAFDVALRGRAMPPSALAGSCLILIPSAWLMARGGAPKPPPAPAEPRPLDV